jgi:hypothetical protein
MSFKMKKWTVAGSAVCVLFLAGFVWAVCPPQGSGLTGVDAWTAANCAGGQCSTNPATTCNEEFTIEFLGSDDDGQNVTFDYEICQIGGRNALSHWTIGLGQITGCVDESLLGPYGLEDIIVAASLDGDDLQIRTEAADEDLDGDGIFGELKEVTIGLDPTTQLFGLKFDRGVSDNGCHTWSITFDTSFLMPGYNLCEGCTVGATKAGSQDIRTASRKSPGYACVVGPVCCRDVSCDVTETAFAFGGANAGCFLLDGFSRWGWTNSFDATADGEYVLELWAGAGQCDLTKGALVGTVTVAYDAATRTATVSYDIPGGMSQAHVYVGCGKYPLDNKGNPTVAPGQYPSVTEFDEPAVSQTVTFTVPVGCDEFHVIAHAVACMN